MQLNLLTSSPTTNHCAHQQHGRTVGHWGSLPMAFAHVGSPPAPGPAHGSSIVVLTLLASQRGCATPRRITAWRIPWPIWSVESGGWSLSNSVTSRATAARAEMRLRTGGRRGGGSGLPTLRRVVRSASGPFGGGPGAAATSGQTPGSADPHAV